MKVINIVYIDDKIDESISEYLDSVYLTIDIPDVEKKYEEISFEHKEGYESLLNNTVVAKANVIVIDNRLFEQCNANSGKFTGNQFKILLRRLHPFIEVLVVSQFGEDRDNTIIPKYNHQECDPVEYYNEVLKNRLDDATMDVLEFERLAEDLDKSVDIKKELIEKIKLSMKGDEPFRDLSKEDVDRFIKSFQELKESL